MIKNKVKSVVRGYDLIEIKLEPGCGLENNNLVYYDGIAWEKIGPRRQFLKRAN
jgi:hypothetical protein